MRIGHDLVGSLICKVLSSFAHSLLWMHQIGHLALLFLQTTELFQTIEFSTVQVLLFGSNR